MADNLSPNVDLTEHDAAPNIPSVTSAVGAIVMHTVKGPVNKLLLVTDPQDLESQLGRPNDINFGHWFTAEAFSKASNQLYVVRVEKDTKAVAGMTVGLSATGLGNVVLDTSTTKPTALFPLSYNDIKINEAKVNYTLPAGVALGNLDNAANALYNEDVFHFYGVGPGTFYNGISITVVNSEDFEDLIELKGELAEATTQDVINTIAAKYYNGTPATTSAPADDFLSASLIKYDILTPPGIGATDWFVNTSMLATLTSFEVGPVGADEGVLVVWDEFGHPTETYLFSNIVDKKDGLGNSMFGPTQVNGNSALIYFFIGNDPTAAAGIPIVTVRQTYLAGADLLTGDVPGSSLSDLTGEILTAWETNFTNPENLEVDILIDPDYPDVVKRYLDSLCKEIRKDCMSVLQVPQSYMMNTTNNRPIAAPYTSMKNYVGNVLNINSSYSAIYGNYFKIFDRFAEKNRWVPVTGFVAAVMAFTDFNDAQWFAPAGLNRGIISNVTDIAVNPNKGQRDVLYYNRINPIVRFQGEGIVIWGQKTLQSGASAFDRINVRRLFLHLEKSVKKMARNFLFEFNDDFSRSRFRGLVNPFLTDVKARRGVYDFLVVCDETNNPPVVIDQNEFHADILVKPARVAEFIKLSFTAVGTGVDFSEVVVK